MNKRQWLTGLATATVTLLVAGCANLGQPAAPTIADALATNPQFGTLNRLVRQAGLADTLGGAGPYTVFAPTDEAFKNVPAKALDELGRDPARLKAVLSFHVVAGKVTAATVTNGKLKSLEGADLATSRAGDFVTVDEAMVTRANVPARNGVIHVVDRVLMPPKR